MGATIGQLLPLALGIAISPLPIIAGILMLMSPRARSTSVGFLLGWLAGIAFVITVFSLLSSLLPESAGDGTRSVLAVVQIALGLLLLLASRQWRGRRRQGAQPTVPKWMQQIDGMSFTSALGLGLLLSGANPKNLLLGASAGVTLGAGALGGGATTAMIVTFTVLAGSTVLIPVVGFLLAASSLRDPLDRLREWLLQENAVIMSILLLVLGVVVIGKGLGGFT